MNCIKTLGLELKEAEADAKKEGKWYKDLLNMVIPLKKNDENG